MSEPATPRLRTEPSPDTVDLLLTRRSTVARDMVAPGPSADELQTILSAGVRVPDHGKIAPWRFIVFEREARAAFGAVLERAFKAAEKAPDEDRVAFERERFLRAPVVVAVISTPVRPHKIPEWEQVLSAGAVCQNMLIAATALGFAAQWLTEWYAYDAIVTDALGVQDGERVAGFVYLGTRGADLKERARPDLGTLVTRWQAG